MYLLAVIYLAFISLGLPDLLLGSAWSTMQKMFDVPISSCWKFAGNHRYTSSEHICGFAVHASGIRFAGNYVSIKLLSLYLLIFIILMICMTEKVFKKEKRE